MYLSQSLALHPLCSPSPRLPWNPRTPPSRQSCSTELLVIRQKPQGQSGLMYQNLVVFSESKVQTCFHFCKLAKLIIHARFLTASQQRFRKLDVFLRQLNLLSPGIPWTRLIPAESLGHTARPPSPTPGPLGQHSHGKGTARSLCPWTAAATRAAVPEVPRTHGDWQ